MPKYIIYPKVHIENPTTEIVEAAYVMPADGTILFLDNDKNAIAIYNQDCVSKVEISQLA